jgi:hypothetical protein
VYGCVVWAYICLKVLSLRVCVSRVLFGARERNSSEAQKSPNEQSEHQHVVEIEASNVFVPTCVCDIL